MSLETNTSPPTHPKGCVSNCEFSTILWAMLPPRRGWRRRTRRRNCPLRTPSPNPISSATSKYKHKLTVGTNFLNNSNSVVTVEKNILFTKYFLRYGGTELDRYGIGDNHGGMHMNTADEHESLCRRPHLGNDFNWSQILLILLALTVVLVVNCKKNAQFFTWNVDRFTHEIQTRSPRNETFSQNIAALFTITIVVVIWYHRKIGGKIWVVKWMKIKQNVNQMVLRNNARRHAFHRMFQRTAEMIRRLNTYCTSSLHGSEKVIRSDATGGSERVIRTAEMIRRLNVYCTSSLHGSERVIRILMFHKVKGFNVWGLKNQDLRFRLQQGDGLCS